MMSNSLASLMQTLVMLTMAHCALWTKVAKRLEKEPKSDQNVQFIGLSFANFGHAHNGSLCTMEKIVYRILKKGKERRVLLLQSQSPNQLSYASTWQRCQKLVWRQYKMYFRDTSLNFERPILKPQRTMTAREWRETPKKKGYFHSGVSLHFRAIIVRCGFNKATPFRQKGCDGFVLLVPSLQSSMLDLGNHFCSVSTQN